MSPDPGHTGQAPIPAMPAHLTGPAALSIQEMSGIRKALIL